RLVHGRDRVAQLGEDLDRLARVERAPAEALSERLAVEARHDDVRAPVRQRPDVEDADERRMLDFPQLCGLLEETRALLLGRGDGLAQDLERHGLRSPEGRVDGTAPTFAKPRNYGEITEFRGICRHRPRF